MDCNGQGVMEVHPQNHPGPSRRRRCRSRNLTCSQGQAHLHQRFDLVSIR